MKIWALAIAVCVGLGSTAMALGGEEPRSAASPAPPASLPERLSVAAVQMRSTRDRQANLLQIRRHLAWCAERGVQVAVFPECAVTGYFADAIQATSAAELVAAERYLADACRELRIAAVVGTPWREADRLYNSALVIDESGRVVERYHKVQLAESWPTGGDHLSVFRLAGVPCCVIICHDERYPELVRLPVLAGARVVFYVSHESPVTQESKLGPYRAQIQARAVENGVYIVHANAPAHPEGGGSHGQSRLISPDGNMLSEAGMFTEEVLTAELDLRRATAANALRSLSRGPLADWYADGVRRVRIIE